jgi:diguanylate cyclase (GGDEF)-like protein
MGILTSSKISRMPLSGGNILLIDDDRTLCDACRLVLESEGFRVTVASTGSEGMRRLTSEDHYDLVLLDVMLPEVDGWSILARARAAPATARIPIIMLTAVSGEVNEIKLLAAGADDYLEKPFSFDRLMAHIRAICRRSSLQSINPLTGLPGNRQVEQFLNHCVEQTESFWAAAYADIDNFKAYNDCYGFLKGDEVLKATAGLITSAAVECRQDVFIGNIGGDDFLVGFTKNVPREDPSALEEVRDALEHLAAGFDRMIKGFYDNADFARGYLKAESRNGKIEHYTLMALSIAVVTNSKRLFGHPLEINSAFASVKRKAKLIAGSAVCFDQRRR